MKNTIKHIFFDLDHTLWDFDRNSALAYAMLFEKHQLAIDVNDFLKTYRPINMNYWKLYREEKITKQQLRQGRLSDTFTSLHQEVPEDLIDRLADDYIRFLPKHNYLIEGAREVLEYLKPKYVLHIITNGFKEVQYKKLENAKILHFFDTVTNSEEVGVKKPNPIIFEKALQISGANIDSSIMIGDNYEADILGAEKVGIQAICYNYHQEKLPEDILQVSDLKSIKEYL
ncbi:YjjG family noncanonical pyrimidine nucleotidase [Aquimarina hainanensis]|uniref:YjjG family noncanonical pyrimidine nucleotidase n=1 Tax=Aquimarina hainanensis TaxID=1578017 RepID=A0ABW5N7P6_9FLAO|nr:YjjG family noncanonical pyrimidine nucleotidase [Aquimarina sp. TRL1]QKX03769.1 noncanonical pyrimidine nucleotidase, YjjG family [Aquimarina sp. TRL1]